MCAACDHGLVKGADIRSSWIRNSSGKLVPVQYTNIDGIAVFEGCILLGRTSKLGQISKAIADDPNLLDDLSKFGTLGLAIAGMGYRWDNREIPYVIDKALTAPARRQIVLDAVEHWCQHTTIKLREKQDADEHWVRFVDGIGCSSYVGRQGGEQNIVLGSGCSVGNAIHEIGHAVGLWHEQGRPDRDNFIDVIWSNIDPRARHNFTQHVEDGIALGDYDYGSIMHYGARYFAIDPTKETIRVKNGVAAIGQRDKLSAGDIAAVDRHYA